MNEADHEKRVVLPQWLPFRAAARQREAFTFLSPSVPLDVGPSLEVFAETLEDYRTAPSPFVASELMGVAHVLGRNDVAQELAEYVLSQDFLGTVAHSQARSILGRIPKTNPLDERKLIKLTKQRVREFPRDAIAWMDQARLYTVLGFYEKAYRSVLAALHLAPSDRFISRAAIRFFVHFGKWEEALRHALNSYTLNNDPMVFGPLLSVATRLGKLPTRLKSVISGALASKDKFLHSETLEAFGTLELISGADQRSKRFFKQAWNDPARSVVGHSQWILREHLPALAAEQRINFWESKEAVSWLRFTMLDFSQAVTDATDWALEEPYSRAPHILGSMSACVVDRFDDAEAIAKRGLLANPKDDILLNNLAFAQLRNGKIAEGEKTFAPLIPKLSDKTQVAPLATYGLLQMSKGKTVEGAKSYQDAIHRAAEAKNLRLMVRASLNFIISTIDTTKTIDVSLLKSAQTALRQVQDPGCLGAALAITRRLKKSDLTGTDALSVAGREFADSIETERRRFLGSLTANLLSASPKPAAHGASA